MTNNFTTFILLLSCSSYLFGMIPQEVNAKLSSCDNYQRDDYSVLTSIDCSSVKLGHQKGSVENKFDRPVDNSLILILKTNFPYLLPFSKGVEIQVKRSCYIGGKIKYGLPNNWVSYQFLAEKEEPVLASRRGVIVGIQDIFLPDSSLYIRFQNQQNYVLVKHLDGTVACYMGLKRGSVKVQKGQKVTPHMQLGLTAKYNKKEKYQMCFILFCSNIEDESQLSKVPSIVCTRS